MSDKKRLAPLGIDRESATVYTSNKLGPETRSTNDMTIIHRIRLAFLVLLQGWDCICWACDDCYDRPSACPCFHSGRETSDRR